MRGFAGWCVAGAFRRASGLQGACYECILGAWHLGEDGMGWGGMMVRGEYQWGHTEFFLTWISLLRSFVHYLRNDRSMLSDAWHLRVALSLALDTDSFTPP